MLQSPEVRKSEIAIQPGIRMVVEAQLQKSQGNNQFNTAESAPSDECQPVKAS